MTRSATEPGRATRQPSRTREDGSIRHNSRRASRLTVQKPELFRGRHALGGVSGVCVGWGGGDLRPLYLKHCTTRSR